MEGLALTVLWPSQPSSPWRASNPMTATLPMPPVPVIFSLRSPLCMLRALPPIYVSSTSTSPDILSNEPVCTARRMRWVMNQALRWLTPRARPIS